MQYITVKTSFFNVHSRTFATFFYCLAKFSFTRTKTELDYCHQNLNAQIASRIAKRFETQNLRA